MPNMGIPMPQVNRYLSAIKSRFRWDGAFGGAPGNPSCLIGPPT